METIRELGFSSCCRTKGAVVESVVEQQGLPG
jgi:hypothetical protein